MIDNPIGIINYSTPQNHHYEVIKIKILNLKTELILFIGVLCCTQAFFHSVTNSDLCFSLLIKYKTLPKYIKNGIPLPNVIAKRKLS